MNKNNNRRPHNTYKIINLENLFPQYKSHAVVLSEHTMNLHTEDQERLVAVMSKPWYIIDLNAKPNTYRSGWFEEKLTISDPDEQAELQRCINFFIEHGFQEFLTRSLDHIIEFDDFKAGLLTDPFDDQSFIVITNNSYFGMFEHSYGGGHGYLWNRLPKKPLKNDLYTKAWIMERFTIDLEDDVEAFIEAYNNILEIKHLIEEDML